MRKAIMYIERRNSFTEFPKCIDNVLLQLNDTIMPNLATS